MRNYAFRLVNVFAESQFGGNPLCVFEQADGLTDVEMQLLARQFNLSETSFILPPEQAGASARMRIFTPDMEMAFAGHPSLGTAHVVKQLQAGDTQFALECKAGLIPMALDQQGIWTLVAPYRSEVQHGGVQTRPCELPPAQVAAMLGLQETDLLSAPVWVNTGSEQLLVPLKSAAAVAKAQPDSAQLASWPANRVGRRMAYVFAFDEPVESNPEPRQVTARYVFARSDGGFGEDPGTGSACANLGGWWMAQGQVVPVSMVISQGVQMGRPCRLHLEVTKDQAIRVGGRVIEIAQGQVQIE
ncbi:PhzF family phenazine biosynthesis protein [Undibacterium sp. CY18W]|uniref:PhzF family phenazine biosynthesis protein n=1 Tax=Undibacterium hunanense TaxID=2762292 RepID=A0ABR6ZKI8_9BURK|nr:PhzF family phenazine biosynthesis protein [Undibacterium hunanense]MBC3916392.1 PhzF family phenazine biosynthesis protein [Undibacterium hunanense]